MDTAELVDRFPILFHMAEDGTWPSISRHGLLSTEALLELYEIGGTERDVLLTQRRARSCVISHPHLPDAVIRDQLPLKFLAECLDESVQPEDFIYSLNNKVFLWATSERLERLLNARAYRSRPHIVLQVDTASLIVGYRNLIRLAPYNTGSAHIPNAPLRGPSVFQSIEDYPFGEWSKRRRDWRKALAEVTVLGGVPDIAAHVIRVDRWHDGAVIETLLS